MGVPAFFRWLSRKYPSIIVNAVEERPENVDGVIIPIDCTKPNLNYTEFDVLYLDMNGIIHPCCHPEDRPAPKNEDEMMVLIFQYIDRLFSIVRPRRLLYMAIDGVAPRAKMNQQRSRRFRASKESADKRIEIENVRNRLESEGIPLVQKKAETEHFDSNCITPGTPFMARLAESLQYYIHLRLNSDPAWQKIQVILSDANAPGEGEHKIMDFIRRQRASSDHDPNTSHCLCGADADLIMLGLATHEPNFNILREEFVPNQPRACELCGQYGHELKDCQGMAAEEVGPDQADPGNKEKSFIFIRLPVLREYLQKELFMPNLPFKYDLERAIDDWVFMCFFVGNDFLPHLPSLEIREGAIDRLVKLYKDAVYKTGGYLTENGHVNLERVQLILTDLGQVEDGIFKQRQQRELDFRARNKAKRQRERRKTAPNFVPQNQLAPTNPSTQMTSGVGLVGHQVRSIARNMRMQSTNGDFRRDQNDDDDEDAEPHDDVRLWEDGWKERYYQAKFEVSSNDRDFRRRVSTAYVQGLCWVLQYYYQGCSSWKWFFPFHYSPFSSDFDQVANVVVDFSSATKPFNPLEQLMGVFPAASGAHLPPSWRHLMTDLQSAIIDFYPDDFQVDLNGKKFAWQGVALLPFVEEERLLDTLDHVYGTLTDDEMDRNKTEPDRIFVGEKHDGFDYLKVAGEGREGDWLKLEAKYFYGMGGQVAIDLKTISLGNCVISPLKNHCQNVPSNRAIMMLYRDPHSLGDAGHRMMSHELGLNSTRGRGVPQRSYDQSNRCDYGRDTNNYGVQIGHDYDNRGWQSWSEPRTQHFRQGQQSYQQQGRQGYQQGQQSYQQGQKSYQQQGQQGYQQDQQSYQQRDYQQRGYQQDQQSYQQRGYQQGQQSYQQGYQSNQQSYQQNRNYSNYGDRGRMKKPGASDYF